MGDRVRQEVHRFQKHEIADADFLVLSAHAHRCGTKRNEG